MVNGKTYKKCICIFICKFIYSEQKFLSKFLVIWSEFFIVDLQTNLTKLGLKTFYTFFCVVKFLLNFTFVCYCHITSVSKTIFIIYVVRMKTYIACQHKFLPKIWATLKTINSWISRVTVLIYFNLRLK